MTGAWIPQTFADYPFPTWSVEVGGKWYMGGPYRNGNGFGSRGQPGVVEVNTDGTFTIYTPALSWEFAWKAATAFGIYIYIPLFTQTDNVLQIYKFNTVTKAFTLLSLSTSPHDYGSLGKGCIGPDGALYFPPYGRIATTGGILRLDPTTDAMTINNFAGAWPATEYSGHLIMGGDGHAYIFPGSITAYGGGYQSGTKLGYLTWPGPTLTWFPPPLPPDYGDSGTANTWIAAYPAADGAYGVTSGGNFYKITTAGPEFLQSGDMYADPGWYVDNGELTDSAEFDGNLILGPDGLLYIAGSTYRSSGNYTPVMATINPANDEVHFEEFPAMTGKPYVPSVSYLFDGKIRTVSLRSGAASFPDIFESTLYVPPTPPGPLTMTIGSLATPVSLILGEIPVSGRMTAS